MGPDLDSISLILSANPTATLLLYSHVGTVHGHLGLQATAISLVGEDSSPPKRVQQVEIVEVEFLTDAQYFSYRLAVELLVLFLGQREVSHEPIHLTPDPTQLRGHHYHLSCGKSICLEYNTNHLIRAGQYG